MGSRGSQGQSGGVGGSTRESVSTHSRSVDMQEGGLDWLDLGIRGSRGSDVEVEVRTKWVQKTFQIGVFRAIRAIRYIPTISLAILSVPHHVLITL